MTQLDHYSESNLNELERMNHSEAINGDYSMIQGLTNELYLLQSIYNTI